MGPIAAYRAMLETGEVEPDSNQEQAVAKLHSLYLEISGKTTHPSWKTRLGFRRQRPPKGLYLYGEPGRGKTMLMDMFFNTVESDRKERHHFHAFMLDIHRRLHRRRHEPGKRPPTSSPDPLPPIARELARRAQLLCFDEFDVRDITDAMLLARLFGTLFQAGVAVVTTSNQAPDRLYPGGLQRQLFLPFIDLLRQHLDVHHLGGSIDYRWLGFRGRQVYFCPDDDVAHRALEHIWLDLSGHAPGRTIRIEVQGRTLEVREAAGGIGRFGFAELCDRPLGAADYLAIADHFHTVILSTIPTMTAEQRDQARRVSTLIDILYDRRIKLICSAADRPGRLYPTGTGAFEFRRTASRLLEMQTDDYLTAAVGRDP